MSNFFSKNIRIALDLDEVIIDFIGGYKQYMGIKGDVKNFNFSYATNDIVHELHDSFWKALKPKISPNDINFLPVAYISKRHFDERISQEWIESNGFPCVPIYHIKEGSKIPMVKKLEIDYFVDDHILNFQELSNAGIKTFLMDCQHNQQFNVGDKRLFHLNELINKIEKDK